MTVPSNENNDLSFKHQHSMEILENRLQIQNDDFAAYETKVQGFINISAFLVAIVGVVISGEDINLIEKILVTLFFIAVFGVLFWSVKALSPMVWKAVIPTDEAGLKKFQKDITTAIDSVYYERIFHSYLEALPANRNTLEIKRWYMERALYTLYAEIALLGVMILFVVWD